MTIVKRTDRVARFCSMSKKTWTARRNRQCLVCDSEDDKNSSYFSFPSSKQLEIKRIWEKFCILFGVLRENDDTKYCRICSKHFTPDCFIVAKNLTGPLRLKKCAVPTIYKPEVQNPDTAEIPTDYYLKHQLKELEKFNLEHGQIKVENERPKKKELTILNETVDVAILLKQRKKPGKAITTDHTYVKPMPSDDVHSDSCEASSSKLLLEFYVEKRHLAEKKCRICLAEDAENNLFSSVVEDVPMDQVYKEVFSVELEKNDNLPQNICSPCVQLLELFYSYKKKVLSTEVEFRHMFEEEEDLSLKVAEEEQLVKRQRELQKNGKIKKKLLLCDECGKFVTCLYEHKRAHLGIKSFMCEFCGKGFMYKSNLKSHLYLHQNLKPFQCQICDAKYTSSSHLWSHRQRVHLGRILDKNRRIKKNKSEACPHCNRVFYKKSGLLAHINARHRTKNVTRKKPELYCWCGEKFTSNISRRLHYKEKHQESIQCPVCPTRYVKQINLEKHVKEKHVSTDFKSEEIIPPAED